MTQSIIVYRNPAEAAIWEGNILLSVTVGVVIGLLSVVLADTLLRKFAPKFYDKYGSVILFPVACSMSVATIWFLT